MADDITQPDSVANLASLLRMHSREVHRTAMQQVNEGLAADAIAKLGALNEFAAREKRCIASEADTLRARVAELEAEVQRLRAALRMFMSAGFGNSTDHQMQRAAIDAAGASERKEG